MVRKLPSMFPHCVDWKLQKWRFVETIEYKEKGKTNGISFTSLVHSSHQFPPFPEQNLDQQILLAQLPWLLPVYHHKKNNHIQRKLKEKFRKKKKKKTEKKNTQMKVVVWWWRIDQWDWAPFPCSLNYNPPDQGQHIDEEREERERKSIYLWGSNGFFL